MGRCSRAPRSRGDQGEPRINEEKDGLQEQTIEMRCSRTTHKNLIVRALLYLNSENRKQHHDPSSLSESGSCRSACSAAMYMLHAVSFNDFSLDSQISWRSGSPRAI
jgi:hypothetical protein